ncbi:MAG: preprotein translocase subunit SecG [Betaproteobacteria bacterium]|jgi:preprotein translocase subunit SecG|nr:MAG: preprotein translocase subunit SecG [Betaproteobacteria bacterium]
MSLVVLIIHVLAAAGIIGLVLMQHGKGADMGAAFGSGSAGSLFGASGSANFLSRSTSVFAVIFFVTSMGLSYLSFEKSSSVGVMSSDQLPVSSDVPVPELEVESDATADGDSVVDEIPE